MLSGVLMRVGVSAAVCPMHAARDAVSQCLSWQIAGRPTQVRNRNITERAANGFVDFLADDKKWVQFRKFVSIFSVYNLYWRNVFLFFMDWGN